MKQQTKTTDKATRTATTDKVTGTITTNTDKNNR